MLGAAGKPVMGTGYIGPVIVGALGGAGAGIFAMFCTFICHGTSGGGSGGMAPCNGICGNGMAMCGYICIGMGMGGIIGITGGCMGWP